MVTAYLPALVVGLLFAVGFVMLLLKMDKDRKGAEAGFFDQLADLRSGETEGIRSFSAAGRRVHASYFQGSKNSPSVLSLYTEVSAPAGFSLKKQGAASGLAQKLGLETDISTGDPLFDDRFDVDCDEPGFAADYFASAKKREAVYALFDNGCASLSLDETGLRAEWTPFAIQADTSADFLRACLPAFAVLAGDLPAPPPPRPAGALGRKKFDRLTGTILGGGSVLLGLFVLFSGNMKPIDSWEFFLFTAPYSAAAWLAFSALVFFALKGRTWFLSGLAQASGLGLIFFGLLGFSAGVWLNVVKDPSPVSPHETVVTGKTYSQSKNSTTYYVFVASWRPGRHSESLVVEKAVYDQVVQNRSRAVVRTRAGYFGYEHIVRADFSF